jgi:hypothetical protein
MIMVHFLLALQVLDKYLTSQCLIVSSNLFIFIEALHYINSSIICPCSSLFFSFITVGFFLTKIQYEFLLFRSALHSVTLEIDNITYVFFLYFIFTSCSFVLRIGSLQ